MEDDDLEIILGHVIYMYSGNKNYTSEYCSWSKLNWNLRWEDCDGKIIRVILSYSL